jgi:glycerol-3-phosphate dehydrogenase
MLLSASGQHNDARMNLAIALTAARYGAATANYMEVVSLLKKTDPETGKERVSGARCKDVLTGMPGSTREAFPSILPCLYNDRMRICLSPFFQ